ncbi:MAG: enoyl-CoA hydratase/isomerase family protein [Adlercreutzia equolifaciens]
MRRCEQPIIGALKGFAVGGGLSISCACDMRVLGESYKMNAGYLSIGYTGTDMGGSFFLPKIVGYARACEILMNPARFGRPEALRVGLRQPRGGRRRRAGDRRGHGRGDVPRDRALRSAPHQGGSRRDARWTAPASRTASRWRTATRCWPPTLTTASWAR